MWPHEETYTRLKPSKIHGIGVFAIRNIPHGTELFKDPTNFVTIDDWRVKQLKGPIRKLYEDYCVFEHGWCYAPEKFESMGMGWYLNHSAMPNCTYDGESDKLITRRTIKSGTELTINYKSFSER